MTVQPQDARFAELCRQIAEMDDDDPRLKAIEEFIEVLEHRANGTLH